MAATINIPVYSDALVVLGTAGVVVPLARYVGLNPVLGYLGAGVLLGPKGLGSFIGQFPFLYWFTVVDAGNVKGIADLGVVFLLFLVGLELSFDRLLAMRRLVFGLGGSQFVVTAFLSSLIIGATGQVAASVSIILGSSLALSSTAIVLEVLASQGKLTSSVGRASFAILLAQDLAVIPVLMLISVLGAHTAGSLAASVGQALINAAIAVGTIVLVGRIVLRPLFQIVGAIQSAELLTAAVLFVIIGTGVLAAVEGLSMALGAFVSGLLLAETEYRKAVEAIVEPFKGLLLGVFFFTVGTGLDLRDVIADPLAILALVFGLVALKAVIIATLSRAFDVSWPAALETGLLLGPGGEFAFVAVGMSATLGLVSPQMAAFVLAVTSLTMALIPALSVVARQVNAQVGHRVDNLELKATPGLRRGHAIVVGHGRIGDVVTSFLDAHKVPYVAVDSNPDVVSAARQRGHEVFFGDAAQTGFLRACGIMDAKALVVTTGSQSTADAIVIGARQLRPDILIVVRARDTAHARHLYSIGVSDAVPETIEASLQISEAVLVGLGVPARRVIASVHEKRDDFRSQLRRTGESGEADR